MEKDLTINNKELVREWDYEKNKDLDVNKLTIGSGKKANWICSTCGYKWKTQIYLRKKHGCPNCAHQKVGYANSKVKNIKDSLLSCFPDVIKVWNYEKNYPLKPENFGRQSNQKVWWKCSMCGKEWKASIYTRKNTLCPDCIRINNNNRTYEVNESNCLANKSPIIAKQWNYKKNYPLTPNDVSNSSSKKVWWICEKGHEWETSIISRTKHNEKEICPFCSNRKLLKGFNDIATTNPELLKEWDYEKNKVKPDEMIKGSHIKCFWICSNGHSYSASIGNRIRGTGCPYCCGQKVLKGFNDLATTNPELLKEWNYDKNKVKPDEISQSSGKKVWWICEKGHEWYSNIANRTKNGKRGCPVCSNRVLLKGFNDLATTNPELLKEWNYEKNKIKPDEIIAGTIQKAWWKCEKGHEWCASIVTRTKNHFCPICNSSKQTSISEKAIVYYLEKSNIEILENFKIGKKELDIYIPSLKIGIEYDGQYYHTNIAKDLRKNELCNSMGIKLIRIREPELPLLNSSSIDIIINNLSNDHSYMNNVIIDLFKILNIHIDNVDVEQDFNKIYALFQKGEKRDSIAITHPILLEEWDYEKNGELKPEQVSKGSHNDIWWKCSKCNYSWKAKVYTRALGSGCPNCSGRLNIKKPTKLKIGINDFATEHPELLNEWDYEKNNIKPSELKSGSNQKVWWKCKLNHSYNSSIYDRLKGTACPYCANKKVLRGFNDLATTNPELLKEWNYEKNKILPTELTLGSGKKVWWKCSICGKEWQSVIYSRKSGLYCGNCKKNNKK